MVFAALQIRALAHSFARGIFVEGVAQRRACERHARAETISLFGGAQGDDVFDRNFDGLQLIFSLILCFCCAFIAGAASTFDPADFISHCFHTFFIRRNQ
jgi:hypothetical protein